MKSDIDRLMAEHDLDAIFVVGAANHNPAMVYFTGLAHLTDAYVLKKQGEDPVVFHFPMERDEAARTGLETKSLNEYDFEELITEAQGDRVIAAGLRLKRIFNEFGVQGRVSVYGFGDIGEFFGLFSRVRDLLPKVEFVHESPIRSVLKLARMTKDDSEIDRIREMGKITVDVMSNVADFLTTHRAKDGVLVDRQDEVLTIGEVKRRINLWLAMKGAENPEGTIFAIGADAGVPHSVGLDHQPVELEKTIIFDLFPCEPQGGYFYDCTRTWCLGHASDEILQTYQDVFDVYHEVYASIEAGKPCASFQDLTCELFQARNHPTIKQNRQIEEGYVHTLAHGVGLDVHEAPWFRSEASNTDMLLPGSVITVEPGLYYPSRGLGVRLEDTVWVRPDGTLETLVEYPMDLVLEVPSV
jgi:Xaa-Pro aminopeptidase